MRRLERGTLSPRQARRRLKKIQPWIEQQIRDGNYLPMPASIEDLALDIKPFDVELGHLSERPEVPFGIRLYDGTHHILIAGKPGAGKTVALKVYMSRVVAWNETHPGDPVQFIVLDFKPDLPNPEKIMGDNCVHLSVHHPDIFRFAINGPPGVPPRAWSAMSSLILASRLGLVISRSVLATVYDWLMGVLNPNPSPDKPLVTPSLRLILSVLTHSPIDCWGAKTDYVRTLIQQLHALLQDAGDSIAAERGMEVNEDILNKGKHLVLDISDYNPPYLRYILTDLILMQILLYRIHNHLKTSRTRICVVIDEADFFAQQSAQMAYPDGLSPIMMWARLAREYGIQFVISVSAPQNLAPYLLTGATYLLAFNTVDGESMWHLKNTLSLERGTERLFPRLKAGQCIYREAQGPYPFPMLAQMDFIEPDHSSKSKPYDAIPFRLARDLDDLPEVQKALQERIAEQKKTTLRQTQRRQQHTLTDNERTFLDRLSMNESDPVHVHMGKLSPATQKNILKRLESLELIKTQQVRTSRSPIRFAGLTDKAWDHVNKPVPKHRLRGDPAHTCITRIKQRYDLDHGAEESTCEAQVPGSSGFTDVLSGRNGKYYCTEIVISCFTNVVSHARSCFLESNTIHMLTFVTCLKSDHDKIRDAICADTELMFFLNRIDFMTVDELLREVYKK